MRFWVIGNIAIDERLSVSPWPEPGTSVHAQAGTRDLGGKGANQAIVAARCGADVELIAAIGRDEAGDWASALLMEDGLSTDRLLRTDCPTDRTLVLLHHGGENAVITTTDCADRIAPQAVTRALQGADESDALLLQGNLVLDATRAAFETARQKGMATVFNPSPLRDGFADLLPLIDLLIVNRHEATALSGHEAAETGANALRTAGAGTVVVTLGAEGALAISPSGKVKVAAKLTTAVDTTGAGDTFAGVLVALWAEARTIDGAMLEKAASASSISVGRPGTRSAFPSRRELAQLFKD